jgi:uncharacterized membrane protein (DUF2068 family)
MSRADRLLPWIAAERVLRAVLLIAAGLVLVTHIHHDWAASVRHVARSLGLDPARSGVQRLADRAGALRPTKLAEYGVIGLAYGGLEGVEGYGLWRRRSWAERLTVFATAILIVPEVWELSKRPTVLKALALVVNLGIVAYLVARLRRKDHVRPKPAGAGPGQQV